MKIHEVLTANSNSAAPGQQMQQNLQLANAKKQVAQDVSNQIKLNTKKPGQQQPLDIAKLIDQSIAGLLNGPLSSNPALAAKIQNPNPNNPMMPNQ